MPGEERPALIDNAGRLRDLTDHVEDIGPETLSPARLSILAAIDVSTLPVVEDENARLGPPVRAVGRIICIGLNYTDHAAEVKLPLPVEPTIFLEGARPTGPNDPVTLPRNAQ